MCVCVLYDDVVVVVDVVDDDDDFYDSHSNKHCIIVNVCVCILQSCICIF